MKLSIIKQITITVALISGVVFAVVGGVFFLFLEWNIKAKGSQKAQALSAAVGNALFDRLDEDILVDFAGEAIQFDKLTIPYEDWAVIRHNGQIECVKGIFAVNPFIARRAIDPQVKIPEMKDIKLAWMPFVSKTHVLWDDLPDAIHKTVMATVPEDGSFLNAKDEVSGNTNGYAVKWLCSDRIIEITCSLDGMILETEEELLPETLPVGMEIKTLSGQLLDAPQIISWQSRQSELLAIIKGRLQNGETAQVAVNRFNEHFPSDRDSAGQGRLPETQLWIVTAYDLGLDIARNRSSGYAIILGGFMMWLLIVLVAWSVTRHSLGRVDRIISQVERINPAQMDKRLSVGEIEDELSRLSQTVNKMLDRIQGGYQREQQFTGDVSHELRNPLAKIIAEIDWAISKSRRQAEYEQTLSNLKSYSKNMQSLIESLLLLSRLEDGSHNCSMETYDLADLIMELLEPFPSEMMRRIHLDLGNEKEPFRSIGHRQLIGTLLRNLIDNALRYSPPQSAVTLRVHRNCKSILIEVEDAGQGIPEEQKQLVFNRFHRVDKSRSKQTGGVGLGLSIVKAIADLHHTTVTLRPGKTQGTIVEVRLPLYEN